MSGCLECGEVAKFQHPEYPADNLCGSCLICWWETHIDESIESLQEAEKDTGIKSSHYTVNC